MECVCCSHVPVVMECVCCSHVPVVMAVFVLQSCSCGYGVCVCCSHVPVVMACVCCSHVPVVMECVCCSHVPVVMECVCCSHVPVVMACVCVLQSYSCGYGVCVCCSHVPVVMACVCVLQSCSCGYGCICVAVMFLDGRQPVKYGLKLEIDEKYRLLKEELAKLCGLPSSRILLVEMYASNIRVSGSGLEWGVALGVG